MLVNCPFCHENNLTVKETEKGEFKILCNGSTRKGFFTEKCNTRTTEYNSLEKLKEDWNSYNCIYFY